VIDPSIRARSRRLSESKFAEALGAIGTEETVVLIDDCDAQMLDVPQPRHESKLVAVLTNDRVLLLRGRGMMGPKKPWVMRLTDLDHAGATREGNFNLEASDPTRGQDFWKLILRDATKANEWFEAVNSICNPDPPEAVSLVRLHEFVNHLEATASPDELRQQFGPGAGLEDVVAKIESHFADIEQVRFCDRLVMVELLTQVPGDDPPATTLDLMGFPSSLPPDGSSDPMAQTAGAAIELIRQFNAPESLTELWESRGDVALEMFAWHCVARQRLATAGILPPAGPNGSG
jgi:hypothetical protein